MDTEQLLELLWEGRMETAILQAQRSDSRYMEAEKLARKMHKKIENMDFNEKQYWAIDRAISAQNNVAVEFGRLSYCQGFRDCLKLIVESTSQTNFKKRNTEENGGAAIPL